MSEGAKDLIRGLLVKDRTKRLPLPVRLPAGAGGGKGKEGDPISECAAFGGCRRCCATLGSSSTSRRRSSSRHTDPADRSFGLPPLTHLVCKLR